MTFAVILDPILTPLECPGAEIIFVHFCPLLSIPYPKSCFGQNKKWTKVDKSGQKWTNGSKIFAKFGVEKLE